MCITIYADVGPRGFEARLFVSFRLLAAAVALLKPRSKLYS
jgi:hypothetical protein